MNNKQDNRKVWFVEFPTYQYVEDVKDLATVNKLRIVDAKFRKSYDEKFVATEIPKLTKKPAKKAK